MNEKYWVRHRSLSGFVGPLTVEELGRAVRAASLPADCDVRQALAGVVAETLDGHGWTPAWRLLGIDPPPRPEAEVSFPDPDASGVRVHHVLADLRRRSGYRGARVMALTLAVVLTIMTLVAGFAAVMAAAKPRSGITVLAACTVVATQLVGLFLGYRIFLMLADIADCQLRQQIDRVVERTAVRRDET